ncbi:hypothetical protein Pla108_31440 [Botrimarina colliarenosi]|uniref:Uncharacterized protein n=1 Tax=Botrimarina colliarenosi TaxID=2528001 RepID=A0A5C6A7S7_9BACT|nr:hypothetical protein [Botrimarina colliarenosi]TWT96062.1 hypothetical protein Pla108_31440 [Botrimarina colliarenosi]
MAGNHKGGGVKQLVLQHVEKVVALLLVAAAGYLAYSSLGVETLKKSPGDLSSQSQAALAAWERSTLAEVPKGDFKPAIPVVSYKLDELPFAPYDPENPINPPVVPPTVDRVDPKLLAATDLEGTAVTAIFAFESEEERKARLLEERRKAEQLRKEQEAERERGSTELLGGGPAVGADGERTVDDQGRKIRPIPGGNRQEGVPTTGYERFRALSAACVLAKAPILDQAKIFEDALRDARGYNPSSDIPYYIGLFAERAEVTGEEGELKWETVKFGDLSGKKPRPALSERFLLETIADWIPYPDALVDARYEHPILTMPLAPLVQQNWGPDVVHNDAPLQTETDAIEAAKARDGDEADLPVEPEDGNVFGRVGDRAERGGGEYGGRGAVSRRGGGEFGGEYGGGGGRGGYGGGEYGGGGRGGSARGATGEFTINPDVPFAMVRFWDFEVQPGRQYRYRVKLVLEDVNNFVTNRSLDRSWLSPEVLARLEKNNARPTTEWSEPSSIISVPMAGDAFIAGAKLPSGRSAYAEGSVDLLVQSYSIDEDRRAIKAGIEDSFPIGAVLNLVEDAEVISPDGRYLVEMDSFKFRTGLTLCDFSGGEELPGKMKAPAKALFMDASGRLLVHDELDDRATVKGFRDTFDESAAGAGGFGGGFGGGEFGGGRRP